MTALTLLAGALLVVADFVELFRIEVGRLVVDEQTGGSQHAYAVAVIGAAMIGATLLARSTEQWPPAAAAAGLALGALAIAVFGDLLEATRSDLVAMARPAKADPSIGLTLEILAASFGAVSGAVLAFLLRR